MISRRRRRRKGKGKWKWEVGRGAYECDFGNEEGALLVEVGGGFVGGGAPRGVGGGHCDCSDCGYGGMWKRKGEVWMTRWFCLWVCSCACSSATAGRREEASAER